MISAEVVRSLRIQQHSVSAREEMTSRTGHISDGSVLGYGTKGDILSGGRIREVIPHPDEIEIGGDEDQYTLPT